MSRRRVQEYEQYRMLWWGEGRIKCFSKIDDDQRALAGARNWAWGGLFGSIARTWWRPSLGRKICSHINAAQLSSSTARKSSLQAEYYLIEY